VKNLAGRFICTSLETAKLLSSEMPDIIQLDLWSPNSADLNPVIIRYRRPCRSVSTKETCTALM